MWDERRGGDADYAGDPIAAAIQASEMAMVVTDAMAPDNPIIYANDAFERLTGYPREESVGRNCRFMQGPDTDPADVARVREAVAHGQAVSLEILNYRRDGHAFWSGLYVSPVRDATGRITHFFGAQLDVSEKKMSEHAFRRQRDSLELAVEHRTAALSRALEGKTALLHELDHRVKNNLQLVASLIMLQMRRTREAEARDALRSVLERVSAISTVHRRLFQVEEVDRFEVVAFVEDLAMERGVSGVRIAPGLAEVTVPVAQAAALALVVNELLAFALDDTPPEETEVSLRSDGEGRLCIQVDGARDERDAGDAFGREIVDMLKRQLRADARLETADGVRRACLTLPR